MKKLFNTKIWYISHIILLIAFTLGVGYHLGTAIHLFSLLSKLNLIWLSHIVKIFWYSIFAYIFDTLFHSLTGLD